MGIDKSERLERRSDRAVTLWVGFGSALLAGLIGLAGVALGSVIAADQAQKAVAAERELAARKDLIDTTTEFDRAVDVQYRLAIDLRSCLADIAAGSRVPCSKERQAYFSAWIDTRAAFAKASYFAPRDVVAAASDLVAGMPGLTLVSDRAMSGPFMETLDQYKYSELHVVFVDALCKTINPYSDACGSMAAP